MKHLIISREYPPASYPPGGIGTYVANIARLLVERGETVHIIGERWSSAPEPREITCGGRLIIHRIGEFDLPPDSYGKAANLLMRELSGLRRTAFPNQWFAWHAALVAEKLIDEDAVDIVEAQEWEAPLYYLLLRRALGLGPRRVRPCIVHIHSPTEFIRHFNGAVDNPPQYMLMKRMEAFCIHAADALLCPSHYVARQCSEHYRLPRERIKVIRLPVGSTPLVTREPQVWAHGSICYIGRIEPRKGIIEWVEAARQVASEDRAVHFDFIGADIWGLQRSLLERLPNAMRSRFRFHGSKPRDELSRFLVNARTAVVPSRWENFPNVGIEAMSSGLPVIATRLGGMVELVEDGRTGWLAPDTSVAGMVDGLAHALRRSLVVSAHERASMGRAAAEAVRRICDNDRTVDEQIAFRAEVCHLGAARSLTISGLDCSQWLVDRASYPVATRVASKGAGIVVRVDRPANALPVLHSIRTQIKAPRAVTVVCAMPAADYEINSIQQVIDDGVIVLVRPGHRGADAWNLGLTASPRMGECGFWLFLDQHDSLLPDCLEQVEKVLLHRPEVGIIVLWTETIGGSPSLDAPLCPLLRFQLTGNDVTPASAFRAEAIGQMPPFHPGMPRGYDIWDVANKVMAKGWSAVTYPKILAQRRAEKANVPWPEATALRAVRAELLRSISDNVDPHALDLIGDYVPIPLSTPEPDSVAVEPLYKVFFRYTLKAVMHPRRAARAIARRSRTALMISGLSRHREMGL